MKNKKTDLGLANLRGVKAVAVAKPAHEVMPICPEPPCASHYDNDGCLDPHHAEQLQRESDRVLRGGKGK